MRTALCVTPPGRSAIASIRVSGFDSLTEFESFFSPANSKVLDSLPIGRIVFGHWSNLHGTSEELVLTLNSSDEIDIHCHGGSAAVSAILDSLDSIGFEIQSADFSAEHSDTANLSSEINFGLLNAATRKIANVFLGFVDGKFSELLQRLRLEVEESPLEAKRKLVNLRDTYESGQFLRRPARIVLAGEPNVGKSSINNCILGYSRSIIFDQPGTTRDIVTELTTIEGWSFEISDSAGLRESSDEIESAGVELAKHNIQSADLVVWVYSAENLQLKEEGFGLDNTEMPNVGIAVLNKADLMTDEDKQRLSELRPDVLFTDALSGEGIEELMTRIRNCVFESEPMPGHPVLFTVRQYRLVNDCLSALESGAIELAKHRLDELEVGS